MKRKAVAIILIALFAILVIAIPVLAYVYYASVTVLEDGTSAYDMLPLGFSANNEWMADNGFMTATGLDTRVETLSGAARPHMVTDTTTWFATPVVQGGQANFFYTTLGSLLTAYYIVIGFDGYITMGDDDVLEFGNDFESEISSWVDTDAGANKNLVYKKNAFGTYISGATDITSVIRQGQPIVGGMDNALSNVAVEYSSIMGSTAWDVAENQVYQVMPTDGTFCRLYIELDAVVAGGATRTFTLMKNGAPTALTVTIAAGVATSSDTTNSVDYVASDLVSLRATYTGAPGTPIAAWSCLFVPDTYGECIFLAHSTTDAAGISYCPTQGGEQFRNAEAVFSTPVPCAGTFSDMYVQLSASPGVAPDAYRFELRQNEADATLEVTITDPDTTGSDLVNSDAFAAGDLATIEITPLNVPAATPDCAIGMVFTSTTAGEYPLLGSTNAQPAVAAVEYYHMTTGDTDGWSPVEASKVSLMQASTLRDLYVEVNPAPGGAASYTIAVREEGAATGLTTTITGAATTGNDLVNEYTSTTGDTIGIQSTPAGGPALTNVKWGVVAYNPDISVTASGVASGYYPVITTHDGVDVELYVDGNLEGTQAFAGSVINNDNDWIINQNNVMPYMEYYKHTVSGIEQAWYQPNAIVELSTLIDRADFAFDFDAADDVLDCGANALLDITDKATIEVWVYIDSDGEGNAGRIVDRLVGGAGYGLLAITEAGGMVAIEVDLPFTVQIASAVTFVDVPTGVRTHIVAVFDRLGTEHWEIYVDGVLRPLFIDDEGQGAIIAHTANNFLIGDNAGSIRCFDGQIDEVRFYQRAFTQDEVTANYNSGAGIYTPADTTNLEGHWHMSEGTGATAADSSGNGFTATITNASWIGPGLVNKTAGIAGNYDATITWGVNPANVAVTLGSIVSLETPTPGEAVSIPSIDILPDTNSSDWFTPPAVAGTLLTNPLRPLVTILSDSTTLSERQAWTLYALAFILIVTVGTARAVKGHLLISGIACGASIGACVALTIFPLWALVFAIGAVLGGVVAERSPSI